ncbi:MAG: tetratricopeptide repeat protein [Wenzhouxiangellaceae bacterium]|nr:tetratricopeptide repeat protein [Wenzhouxiangellaceae bacterium]
MGEQQSRLHRTFVELRRRHVVRVTGAYAILAWGALEVLDIVLPALQVPHWVLTLLVVLAGIGLPIVAAVTWIYDITPAGVVRTDQKEGESSEHLHWSWRWVDYLIIVILASILVFVLVRDDSGTGTAPGKSIAVLPFSDLSPEQDTRYFSDGMAEAILDQLGRVPGLQVIARTSSFSFRDKDVSVREVADALDVSTILEGSVRKSGPRLLVSARLIDGSSGRSLWSDTYEGTLNDVFRVQDNISRAIGDVLQVRLLGARENDTAPTTDTVAYDEYLRGRSSLRGQATRESAEAAIDHFERALARDPDFVLAKAGLCTAYWQQYQITRNSRHVEDALAACEQARVLDPDRAETQVALGNVYLGTGNVDQALPAFQRALEIEAGNSEAHVGLGEAFRHLGRFDEAERHFLEAIELDPAYWRNYNYLGGLYYDQAEYRKAAARFARAIELEPNASRARNNLGAALWWIGDFERAVEVFRESLERNPTAQAYSNAGANYFYLRRYREAEEMYRSALELTPLNFELHAGLSDALMMQRDRSGEMRSQNEQAIDLAHKALEINPDDHYIRAALAVRLVRAERIDEARSELQLLTRHAALGPFTHRLAGEANLALGDREEAIDQLTMAVRQGYPTAVLASEPLLEPLYDNPDFQALVDDRAESSQP